MNKLKYLFHFGFCYLILVSFPAFSQNNSAQSARPFNPFAAIYLENCAVCHGEQLEGAAQGTPLKGKLKHGDDVDALIQSISKGYPTQGMPNWGESLKAADIKSLALYIAETRTNLNYLDFNVSAKLEIPNTPIKTELHNYTFETVITGIDPLPYSIQPLPDGQILVTEKMHGLRLISPDGQQSTLIEDTPKTYDDSITQGPQLEYGLGWLLDVALHPDYANTGWIYLTFGDRCEKCNAMSTQANVPVSMVKLIRGKINNNQWVEEQVIWQANKIQYTPSPDIAAGGRITFDDNGHLFFSIGLKGLDNHTGVQSLSVPWGKIHRINLDGSIPDDNPFVNTERAIPSIWSYGHRSPQGLEFNHLTGELWGTEMGPRGGDEVNRLLPGRNYGWPLYSKGLDYDGTPVEYGKEMNIEFNLSDIEQPIVDLSPSPAVSSFIFYTGDKFPNWKNNFLVGSLKARSVYRMVLEDNQVVHRETIVQDLARIRDIEQGPDGNIYLLLEHKSGGQIVKIKPN